MEKRKIDEILQDEYFNSTACDVYKLKIGNDGYDRVFYLIWIHGGASYLVPSYAEFTYPLEIEKYEIKVSVACALHTAFKLYITDDNGK